MENNEVVDSLLNENEVVEEKKETKKPAAKKAAKKAEKKTTGKKSTDKKESAVKDTTAQNADVKEAAAAETNIVRQLFIEFNDNQIDEEVIIQKVEEECKQRNITIKELALYFKPEENACYYVVNGDVSENGKGKVNLF